MNFTQFFIRRPAFTIVLSLVITIVGIISYVYLPIRWIPNINPAVVSIYTSYPGASANIVESQITSPIETALAGVSGINTISSNSRQNDSFVTITFKLGYNINTGVEDIRSALQRINDSFPTGVKPPDVEKADPNGMPILFLAFSNAKTSAEDVSRYVKQFINPQIETVDGVATIVTYGERDSIMKILLDPQRMAAANVSTDDINKAISQQNISVPSGQIKGNTRNINVMMNELLDTPEEFNNLIIRDSQNQVVRLKDIASAVVGPADEDSAFRVNGKPAVAIGIIPQSTANPLDVSRNVLKEFYQLQKTLPAGMDSSIVFDQAAYIQSSVDHVYQSLFEATILVLLVIFLFLASWRAAFIPIVTIPVCLISTFSLLYLLGFSINIITLMALVLAIGLVVDDAIVMLENIMRHIERGIAPFAAAIQGSGEIIFSIIAMTLTLAAVYAPIMFTPGLMGAVFKEFSATLAGAVIISGLVALTLSPMMCARLLSKPNHEHPYQKWLAHQFLRLQNSYQTLLRKILDKRIWVISALVVIGIAGGIIFQYLPSELAPAEDMDEIDVFVQSPRDSSFQYTDQYIQQLENYYKTNPNIISQLSQIGAWNPSKSFQILSLKPRNKRNKTAEQVANELQETVKNIPGVQVFASAPPSPLSWVTDSDGRSIEMEVISAIEYKNLHEVTQQLITQLKNNPAFINVDSKLQWDGTHIEVNINRERAADSNISLNNIADTISTLMAGKKVGHYEFGGKQYDVKLQMDSKQLSNPDIFKHLYAKNNKDQMVPLSDFLTVKEVVSPESLPHFDRLRSDVISAGLAPGYTIADAVHILQKTAKNVLPDNVKYSFNGDARNYLETGHAMMFTFMLAIVFIYLVLVAQFESFRDPLVILLTVPFGVIGALVTLKIFGGTLNIYSNIGLVTLIGLIAKHGILITDFANRQQREGKNIHDAVIEAASLRLRPILMTTAAMILGALPLALAFGPGSETRHQIGWVVVGGLLIGTFFSLIVVPIAYTYLSKIKNESAA
jgi:multidrug efflux pump